MLDRQLFIALFCDCVDPVYYVNDLFVKRELLFAYENAYCKGDDALAFGERRLRKVAFVRTEHSLCYELAVLYDCYAVNIEIRIFIKLAKKFGDSF